MSEEIDKSEWINIKELCRLLRKSRPTIYRHLKYGAPDKEQFDINQVPSTFIDGRRHWSRPAFKELKSMAREGNTRPLCAECKRPIE